MNGASESAGYYKLREQAELSLAAKASSVRVRDIHMVMAKRYRELASQVEMPDAPLSGLPQRRPTNASLKLVVSP